MSQPQPFLNTREDKAIRFLGLPSLVRANGESTNGTFGLVEQWDIPPGFVTPYHMHRLEDESFYILEGEVNFVCDGKWISAKSGDFVFGPCMIPHGFKVVGDTPSRMLIFASPPAASTPSGTGIPSTAPPAPGSTSPPRAHTIHPPASYISATAHLLPPA